MRCEGNFNSCSIKIFLAISLLISIRVFLPLNTSSPIYLHTIFFGDEEKENFYFRSRSGKETLQEMANIASKHLPSNTPQGTLCCQFTHNIDEVQLVNHFKEIA